MSKVLLWLITCILTIAATNLSHVQVQDHDWNSKQNYLLSYNQKHFAAEDAIIYPYPRKDDDNYAKTVDRKEIVKGRKFRRSTGNSLSSKLEKKYIWINGAINPSEKSRDDNVPAIPTPSIVQKCQNVSKYIDIFTKQIGTQNEAQHQQELFQYPCPGDADTRFRGYLIPPSFMLEQHEMTSLESSSTEHRYAKELFTITFTDIAAVSPSPELLRAYENLPDTFKGNEIKYTNFIKRYGTSYRNLVVYGGLFLMKQSSNKKVYYKITRHANPFNDYNESVTEIQGFEQNTTNSVEWEKKTIENPVPIFERSRLLNRILDPQLKNRNRSRSFEESARQQSKIDNMRLQIDEYDNYNGKNELARFISQTIRSHLELDQPILTSFELIGRRNENRNYTKYWVKCYTSKDHLEMKTFYIIEGVCRNFKPVKCTNIVAKLPNDASAMDVHRSRNCDDKEMVYRDLNPSKRQNQVLYAFEHGKSFSLHVRGDW